jgi:hypothetical protein
MAAVTYTTVPQVKTATLGSSNVATEFTRPSNRARCAIVTFDANAGKVSYTGTDGASIGADYTPVAAGVPTAFDMGSAGAIFCAAATGSTVVHVAYESVRGR